MARRRKTSRKPLVIPLWAVIVGAGMLTLGTSGYEVTTHKEDNDAFCASCHSEPETTYFDRSTAAVPADLASYHHTQSTRCIDCHSGRGVPGRVGAMMLGAHDLTAWVSNTATQPAPLTRPIGDGHCLKCHSDVPRTRDFNRHFHAFLSTWQARDPNAGTCVSCHTSHTTNGDPTLTFLERDATVQVCQSCHVRLRGRPVGA